MAAPIIVQSAVTSTAGSPLTSTFASAQTAGNWNVVVAFSPGGATGVGLPTDTSGNLYTLHVFNAANAGSTEDVYIYVAKNIAAAGANTNKVSVPWAGGGAAPADIIIMEVSGAAGFGAQLGQQLNDSQGGASMSIALTTQNANSLAIVCATSDNGLTGVSGSFSQVALTSDTFCGVYQDSVSSPSTVTCSLTQNAGAYVLLALELTSVVTLSEPAPAQQFYASGLSVTNFAAQVAGNANLVVVTFQAGSGSPTVTVSDTANGAYSTNAALVINSGEFYYYIFFFPNIASAAASANTITASVSGTGALSNEFIFVVEASGLASTVAGIFTAGQTSQQITSPGYTNPASTGTYTSASANQFALAIFNSDTQGFTAGLESLLDATELSFNYGVEYQITGAVSSTVQATGTFSGGTGSSVVAMVAGFNAAVTPPVSATFQDYVRLSQDSLYHTGAQFQLGGTSASTLTYRLSNTGGLGALAASMTAGHTLWLPSGSGTLLVSVPAVALSAGTQLATSGSVVLSNSNNVSFGMSGSSQITASAAWNMSAGTTSQNLSSVTFSNSNNLSFGLSGSVVTASMATITTRVNFSAGTTSSGLNTVVFSNSHNVSFGLNGSTVTGQLAAPAIAAGTQTATSGTVVLNSSNGFTFGMSGTATVTGAQGGFSSWSNGQIESTFTPSQAFVSFAPIVVPYYLSATQAVFLGSVLASSSTSAGGTTISSGGFSMSVGLYSLTGGSSGSLSLASSASTNLTWTSGAPYSSLSGVNYMPITFATWNVTPGFWLFALWVSTQDSASISFYATGSQMTVNSGEGAALSTIVLPGYSQASVAALPSSFGITNTASYIRTGTSVMHQPWFALQGT
jgi:hypothetical protein